MMDPYSTDEDLRWLAHMTERFIEGVRWQNIKLRLVPQNPYGLPIGIRYGKLHSPFYYPVTDIRNAPDPFDILYATERRALRLLNGPPYKEKPLLPRMWTRKDASK